MTFAEQVKHIRETLLLSQKELSERTGISTVTISRWENGEKKPRLLTRARLYKFCEENGIKFDSRGE